VFSTNNLGTIPSTPRALLTFNLLSLFDIISHVSTISLNMWLLSSLKKHFTFGTSFTEFSDVKTEPKYSLSKLHISSFSIVLYDDWNNCITTLCEEASSVVWWHHQVIMYWYNWNAGGLGWWSNATWTSSEKQFVKRIWTWDVFSGANNVAWDLSAEWTEVCQSWIVWPDVG